MGADLCVYTLVHEKGPVTQEEIDTTDAYLARLNSEAAKADPKDFVGTAGHVKRTELGQVFIDVRLEDHFLCPDDVIDVDEAEDVLQTIINATSEENRHSLLNTLDSCDARDMSGRFWGDSFIYVAGDTTWGDEPEGYGYQALKWLGMLGAYKYLNLE